MRDLKVQESKNEGVVYIGRKNKIQCPNCKESCIYTPKKQGKNEVKCGKCEAHFYINVEQPVTAQMRRGSSTKGKIRILRRWWFTKDYPLHVGRNLIGRIDEERPSDISIENDESISRRSVAIEVTEGELGGYFFKLVVLKSTNEVLHNNIPLKEGDSVSLNYGDIIIIGRTKLRFDK